MVVCHWSALSHAYLRVLCYGSDMHYYYYLNFLTHIKNIRLHKKSVLDWQAGWLADCLMWQKLLQCYFLGHHRYDKCQTCMM